MKQILSFKKQTFEECLCYFFDYNADFAIFVSTISQICQFLIFFDYNTYFAIFAYLRDWFFEDLSVTQIRSMLVAVFTF